MYFIIEKNVFNIIFWLLWQANVISSDDYICMVGLDEPVMKQVVKVILKKNLVFPQPLERRIAC